MLATRVADEVRPTPCLFTNANLTLTLSLVLTLYTSPLPYPCPCHCPYPYQDPPSHNPKPNPKLSPRFVRTRFETPCLRAFSPTITRAIPEGESRGRGHAAAGPAPETNETTEGETRSPSREARMKGLLPLTAATAEFVVPRSMPIVGESLRGRLASLPPLALLGRSLLTREVREGEGEGVVCCASRWSSACFCHSKMNVASSSTSSCPAELHACQRNDIPAALQVNESIEVGPTLQEKGGVRRGDKCEKTAGFGQD